MIKDQKTRIRVKAMDHVRALAIIFMVFTHQLWALVGDENYESFPCVIFEDTMGTWAHTMFLLIVGMSLFFSCQSRKSKNVPLTKHIVIRGLFLIGIGYCLNILWNIQTFAFLDIFGIDILILIGISIIAVYFLFKSISIWGKTIILIICFVLTPILQNIFLYNGPYAYQEYPEDLGGLLPHYLTNGLFPIFPCITYVMLGFILGEILFEINVVQNLEKENWYILGLFLLSIPLVILGYLFDSVDFLWDLFQWEDIYIIMLYGMALLFLAIFSLIERITPDDKDYLKPLSEIGVVSLSIYFFDQLICITFENFKLCPYLPLFLAIIIVLVGIICMFASIHLWLKKYKFGLFEWILRKIS